MRQGRPSGLLANPDAFADALTLCGKSQRETAAVAKVSTAHLSEMIAGRKGASPEQAQRIAAVLGVRPGTLFPQLATFRVEARIFTATGVAA